MSLVPITITGIITDSAGNPVSGKTLKFKPTTPFGSGGELATLKSVKAKTNANGELKAADGAADLVLLTSDAVGAFARYTVTYPSPENNTKTFDLTDDVGSVSLDVLINAFDPAQEPAASSDWLDHEARITDLEDAPGGSSVWGGITGTLSDQTDLQSALNGKQPLDADLTALASLTTTPYGRALLELADAAALTALGNAFTSALKGLVPSSGGGTANFLRADGAWAAPPSGGIVKAAGAGATDALMKFNASDEGADSTISQSGNVITLGSSGDSSTQVIIPNSGANAAILSNVNALFLGHPAKIGFGDSDFFPVWGYWTPDGIQLDQGYMQQVEIAAPSAPAANAVRIYAVDNGGKTELLARFATGAAVRLAIEP